MIIPTNPCACGLIGVNEEMAVDLMPTAQVVFEKVPMRIRYIGESARIAERGIRGKSRVAAASDPALEIVDILTGREHHDFVIAAQGNQFTVL